MGSKSILGPGSARNDSCLGTPSSSQPSIVSFSGFEMTLSGPIVDALQRSMFFPGPVRLRRDRGVEATSKQMATRLRLGQELPIIERLPSLDGVTCDACSIVVPIMILALSNDNVRPTQNLNWAAELYRDIDNNTAQCS